MASSTPAAPKKKAAPKRASKSTIANAKADANASASATVTAEPRVITQNQIALRARDLYVKSGYVGGRDLEFWLEAERQLRTELDV